MNVAISDDEKNQPMVDDGDDSVHGVFNSAASGNILESFHLSSTSTSLIYQSCGELMDISIDENNNNNSRWETNTNSTSNNGDLHFRMLLDNFSEADDDTKNTNNGGVLNLERIHRELEVPAYVADTSLPCRHPWQACPIALYLPS
jgi:hypothetical protein